MARIYIRFSGMAGNLAKFAGLDENLDAVAAAIDFANGKPEPKILATAEHRCQRFVAEENASALGESYRFATYEGSEQVGIFYISLKKAAKGKNPSDFVGAYYPFESVDDDEVDNLLGLGSDTDPSDEVPF